MPPKRKLDFVVADELHGEKKHKATQEEEDHQLALSLQPSECSICLEELDADFLHTLHCQHKFCRDCLGEHLSTGIKERRTPCCPQVGCAEEIAVAEMELLVEPALVEKHTDGSLQSFIAQHTDDYACCPTADCPYLFFYVKGVDSPDFQCPQCEKRYCIQCRVDYHQGSTCAQYQQWSLENGQVDDLFGDLVQGQKMKQCARCRNWIQKAQGCDHMTCRCGFQFCYRCGQKWPHAKCPADAKPAPVRRPAVAKTKKSRKK
jgi:ariadne-1